MEDRHVQYRFFTARMRESTGSVFRTGISIVNFLLASMLWVYVWCGHGECSGVLK